MKIDEGLEQFLTSLLYYTHKLLLSLFIRTYEYSLIMPTIIAYVKIVGYFYEGM